MPHPHPHPSPSDVSMRDLLASCVAAATVSTPPKRPEAVHAAVKTHPVTDTRAKDPRPTGTRAAA